MPRFAASVMFLFAEAPFEERFRLASCAGFRAVECQNPYAWAAEDIRDWLTDAGLDMALINAPAGDPDKGERGFAAVPGRENDFRESLERGLAYARMLSCSRLHVLAGNAPINAETERAYVANVRWAAARAEREGLRVLSQESRESRLAAAEKKAAALPAKLTVPMILFFLRVLFVVIAGPAGINISNN